MVASSSRKRGYNALTKVVLSVAIVIVDAACSRRAECFRVELTAHMFFIALSSCIFHADRRSKMLYIHRSGRRNQDIQSAYHAESVSWIERYSKMPR